jgi:hypothetical protein
VVGCSSSGRRGPARTSGGRKPRANSDRHPTGATRPAGVYQAMRIPTTGGPGSPRRVHPIWHDNRSRHGAPMLPRTLDRPLPGPPGVLNREAAACIITNMRYHALEACRRGFRLLTLALGCVALIVAAVADPLVHAQDRSIRVEAAVAGHLEPDVPSPVEAEPHADLSCVVCKIAARAVGEAAGRPPAVVPREAVWRPGADLAFRGPAASSPSRPRDPPLS